MVTTEVGVEDVTESGVLVDDTGRLIKLFEAEEEVTDETAKVLVTAEVGVTHVVVSRVFAVHTGGLSRMFEAEEGVIDKVPLAITEELLRLYGCTRVRAAVSVSLDSTSIQIEEKPTDRNLFSLTMQ
jgi:hypothetical protein